MTTDPQNAITRSGLKLNPEHAATDTNQHRLFRVVLHVTELRRVVVEVFAETEADAATNAESLPAEAFQDAESADMFAEAVFVHEEQPDEDGDELPQVFDQPEPAEPTLTPVNAPSALHALQTTRWCDSQAGMRIDSPSGREPIQDRDRLPLHSSLQEEYTALFVLAHSRIKALKSRILITVAALFAGLATVVLLPLPLQAMVMAVLPLALAWVCQTTLDQVRSVDCTLWQIKCLEWFAKAPLGELPPGSQLEPLDHGACIRKYCSDSAVDTLLAVAIVFLLACVYVVAEVLHAPEQLWLSYLGFILLVGLGPLIGLVRYHADRTRRHRPDWTR